MTDSVNDRGEGETMEPEDDPSQALTINTENKQHDFGPRFTGIQPVGYGATGLIFSAHDIERKRDVAIKTLSFSRGNTSTTSPHPSHHHHHHQSAQQTLREIKILSRLKHENVVEVLDIIKSDSQQPQQQESSGYNSDCVYNQVLVVQELLDTDLHAVIVGRQLQADHIVFFTYQLLSGLQYIHGMNVIHRDLKPSNILVNCETLEIKITDFGISRIEDGSYNHQGELSPYMGSCWYYAPEQILTPCSYSHAVDVWAAGCILLEMLTSRRLFSSATVPLEQLRDIVDVVFLTEQDWSRVLRIMPNKMLKNHPLKPRRTIGSMLSTPANPQVVELAEWLLTFDPEQRVTASRALSHPYFTQYHVTEEEEEEPSPPSPLHIEHEIEHTLDHESACYTLLAENSTLHPAATIYVPRSASTSPIPPPRHTPSSSPPPELDFHSGETHTLDEILSLHDRTSPQIELLDEVEDDNEISISSSSSSSSPRSSSVEDLNLRNLRRSQENLSTASSYNILQLVAEETVPLPEELEDRQREEEAEEREDKKKHTKEKKKEGDKEDKQSKDEKEVDEKDVAELSAQKLEEDEELEKLIRSHNQFNAAVIQTLSPPKREPQDKQLRVCIDPKQRVGSPFTPTPPRARSPSCNHCVYISDDEEFKEKKLLEMEAATTGTGTLSKVQADNMESEKNDQDLDEMYRLPTEHLRQEEEDTGARDYSNQRLKKHKHLSKLHVRQLLRYRDEINEINERLREEGACGGYADEEEEEILDVNVGGGIILTSTHPPTVPGLYGNDRLTIQLNNEPRLLNTRPLGTDGFSSPEEQPSSPRQQPQQQQQQHPNAGARPKKSPRKQKAL